MALRRTLLARFRRRDALPQAAEDAIQDAFVRLELTERKEPIRNAVRPTQLSWRFVPQAVQERFVAELDRDPQSGAGIASMLSCAGAPCSTVRCD